MREPEFEDQVPLGGVGGGGRGGVEDHPTPREQAALRWITAYVEQMEAALLGDFPLWESLRSRAGALGSQVGSGQLREPRWW